MQYKMSEEERNYLEHYNQADYERPSIATDIVAFTITKEETDNAKQLPAKKLKVLLIERASYPYKGFWALPGGFCRKNEEVSETARRELLEETNVRDAYLTLSGIYGDVDRDPRGWIISHAYLALLDGAKCELRADTDAWRAEWFEVDISKKLIEKEYRENGAFLKYETQLLLTCGDISLKSTIVESCIYKNYHETVSYEIVENDGLAFDHAKLIVNAFHKLQMAAEHDEKIVFDLMPELFTLTELQQVFELVLQRELIKPNFRRKIAEYVVETEEMESGRGYRTAKLFRRNVERFYEE